MAKETPRAKALKTLQRLARLAAADDNGYCTCVSCGGVAYWSEMDGGHFIPKGSSSYWALREENVHPQHKGCNNFGMKYGSAAQEYTAWMIDYYGRDFVDEMFAKKNEQVKFYKRDYERMIKEWDDLIKHHKKRIGHG